MCCNRFLILFVAFNSIYFKKIPLKIKNSNSNFQQRLVNQFEMWKFILFPINTDILFN